MSITATFEAGKIVLPPGVTWPEGTVLRIDTAAEEIPTLRETLKEFEGMASDLPPDMAKNHDHYIHGRPKK